MGVYREMENNGYLNFAESFFRASDSGVYGRMYHLINSYNPATGSYGSNTPEAKTII